MADTPTQYFVACAAIFDAQKRVLLTKRHNPENPTVHNHWQLPGGGIEHNEHPKDALLREIQEETALTIDIVSERPYIYSHTFSDTQAHIVLIVYTAFYKAGTIDISRDSEETNDAQWFSVEEVAKLRALPETAQIVQDTYASIRSL